MTKKDDESTNSLANPVERKNFKIGLAAITTDMQIQEDRSKAITETIDYLSKRYGVDKKNVRKMARTMFKHNYPDIQEEHRHFEELYETIVEGPSTGNKTNDPLDDIDESVEE